MNIKLNNKHGTKNRLISIVNWNEYQSKDTNSEQQVNNNWTTSEHKQECKNNIILFNNKEIKAKPRVKKEHKEFDVIEADPLLKKYIEKHKGEKPEEDLIEDYFWEGLAR